MYVCTYVRMHMYELLATVLLYAGFLNQARAWILEIVFLRTSVCVCVYVSAPQDIKNHSREMKPE